MAEGASAAGQQTIASLRQQLQQATAEGQKLQSQLQQCSADLEGVRVQAERTLARRVGEAEAQAQGEHQQQLQELDGQLLALHVRVEEADAKLRAASAEACPALMREDVHGCRS